MDGLRVLEVVTKAKERVQGNVIILHQQIKVLHVKVHQKRKNCVSCRDVTLVGCGQFYRSCVISCRIVPCHFAFVVSCVLSV